MYKFVDVNETAINRRMSIQTIINGVNLDATLKGFTTLKVEGRELMSREVFNQNFSGSYSKKSNVNFSNRSIYTGSLLPPRDITVEFRVSADGNKEYREVMEYLNYFLFNENMSVQFTDDIKFEYTGNLLSVENAEQISNSTVNRFTIQCVDPFKYEKIDRKIEFTKELVFNNHSLYPFKITSIYVTPLENTDYLRIVNYSTHDNITLAYHFKKGDNVVIHMGKNMSVSGNGIDLMPYLSLDSSIETFNLREGNILASDTDCKVIINYKERRL
ncbi:phage tail family protein [Peptostreptococcaceae bacterium OttesenSCG-928-C18]|nr:phage tail family protein [Peptostreptococcaceae bacterium OttesenSCG-928-C18]